MANTKLRKFGHLTILWTISEADKRCADITIKWDDVDVASGNVKANFDHFNWSAQVDLSNTAGSMNASYVPSTNKVILMLQFQNYSPDHGKKDFIGQLDSWLLS